MMGSKSFWTLILFGFCCLDIWLRALHSLDISLIYYTGESCINPRIENLHFISLARSCASLGFHQRSDLILCSFSQFGQPEEDRICSTKSNMPDISLVESCRLQTMCHCLKYFLSESLPALYYRVYCECFIFPQVNDVFVFLLPLKWPLKQPVNK